MEGSAQSVGDRVRGRPGLRLARIATLLVSFVLSLLAVAPATVDADEPQPPPATQPKVRHATAKEVFDYTRTILFQDDFAAGAFGVWRFSENASYEIVQPDPDRIRIVDAPRLPEGRRAVRFHVERAPDSFRSEISLPHEPGFQERWYGERILIPREWVVDPAGGADIVMQWHAVPGNGKPTNPNLEISVRGSAWRIRQTFGDPPDHKQGWQTDLEDPVRPGEWASWVIHAKWSPRDDGLIQIWKDGKPVAERKGCNVYTSIGVDYTPYLKTGIYHPEWHLDKEGRRAAFDKEKPVATRKVVYVTDVKIGGDHAGYEDVAPER
jgi:hypothetical protein